MVGVIINMKVNHQFLSVSRSVRLIMNVTSFRKYFYVSLEIIIGFLPLVFSGTVKYIV